MSGLSAFKYFEMRIQERAMNVQTALIGIVAQEILFIAGILKRNGRICVLKEYCSKKEEPRAHESHGVLPFLMIYQILWFVTVVHKCVDLSLIRLADARNID